MGPGEVEGEVLASGPATEDSPQWSPPSEALICNNRLGLDHACRHKWQLFDSGERALGSASTNLGGWDTGADYTIDSSEFSSMKFDAETGDGFLRFCLWVSSEHWDTGYFLMNGLQHMSNHAMNGWQQFTIPITAGNHTFEFKYVKDSDSSHGSADRMFIDKLSYPLPTINSGTSSLSETSSFLPFG